LFVRRSQRACGTARPRGRAVVSLALLLGMATGGAAQPAIDRPASIIFLPRVVADADTDTVVQMSNTGNATALATCASIAGDDCQQTTFSILLVKQQPTHWVVARGRSNDSSDPTCSPVNADCDGAGKDPGVAECSAHS
jgi:hypothetical protein